MFVGSSNIYEFPQINSLQWYIISGIVVHILGDPGGSYFVPPQLTASWVSEDVWFIAILQKCGIPEGAGVEGLMASFELKFPLLSLDLHDNIYLVFFFKKNTYNQQFYTLPLPSTCVLSKPPVHCLVHSLLAFDS